MIVIRRLLSHFQTSANVKCEAVCCLTTGLPYFLNGLTCLVVGVLHLLSIQIRLATITRCYKTIKLALVSSQQIKICHVGRLPLLYLSLNVFICLEVEHSCGQCTVWASTLQQTAFYVMLME